ncbi:hypothetical protein ACFPT7_06745 [Acidicapsa dinghuensis]|uniref:Uncharacterized protein n=1 Tax=Acidicapsa dinghuensis TaxID=2218256 RepID=A0ABW1ED94_9BACT|nr:hypothetical protein [Acidicapsa dinghuensis]
MANKTLYVRDSDLGLWDLAQAQLGQSISALFTEFLRERVKLMNVFVHVLRSSSHSKDLTVIFSPVGPTGSGGPGNPQHVQEPELIAFLEMYGVTSKVAIKIAESLQGAQSISELTTIAKRSSAMSESFQASTQYGDWKGTAAADEFGADSSFDELFEATGNVDLEEEIMIGFEFYNIEGSLYVSGYFHPKPAENGSGWYPSLNEQFQKDQIAPIKVKKVRVELTLEQFFKYFKRFNVVLVKGAIDILGREYKIISGVE